MSEKRIVKLFIATPAYGHQVTTNYANSMFKFLAAKYDDIICHSMIHVQSGMALVTQARNNCVAEFMKSDADKLLFIDSDIGFQPEAIYRLLKFDSELVLTPYPVKGYSRAGGLQFIIHFPNRDEIVVDKEGFCEITGGPTGFMMIDRSVFEKMIQAYPEKKCVNKQMIGDKVQTMDEHWYTFFETDVDPVNGYLGEDIAFCNLWRKIGGKIYADVNTRLTHYGGHSFCGSLDQSFKNDKFKDSIKFVDDIRKNK